MKTNAGPSLGYPLLPGITNGTERHDTRTITRQGPGAQPPHAPQEPTKIASFGRAWIAGMNACLAKLRRLSNQAEPSAPRAASVTITLRKGEVVNLTKRHRPRRIHVLSGVIWLTGDPTQGDVIFSKGDSFCLARGIIHVAQALGEATVRLES